eukprot:scaffold30530_cov43-Attheya_sp.AAC.3
MGFLSFNRWLGIFIFLFHITSSTGVSAFLASPSFADRRSFISRGKKNEDGRRYRGIFEAPQIMWHSNLQAKKKNDDTGAKIMKELTGPSMRRALLASWASALAYNVVVIWGGPMPAGFQRCSSIEYVAALAPSPKDSSGFGETWGLWTMDPGPRGVSSQTYSSLSSNNNNIMPAGWKLDPNDFWIEEHGLLMETPSFPLTSGQYLVTGGKLTTAILSYDKKNNSWQLASPQNGKPVALDDVTHGPCRAARYHGGSPQSINPRDFPVRPGALMPHVPGCEKQDYSVLFVIGKETTPIS